MNKGKVIWLTGLSGSGKTTIAIEIVKEFRRSGHNVVHLDGDHVRNGLNKQLGFGIEDRTENIRRVAEVAKILTEQGIIVVCSFISPTIKIREMARAIIKKENFELIYCNCSIEVCEKRDVKGLYKKCRKGLIKEFTGLDDIFEKSLTDSYWLDTEHKSVQQCTKIIMDYLFKKLN